MIGNSKFRSKFFQIFFIYRVMWTLNILDGVSGHQLFLVILNFRSKFFRNFLHLQSTVDLEFFRWDVQVPTFFGDAKFHVKFFSNF